MEPGSIYPTPSVPAAVPASIVSVFDKSNPESNESGYVVVCG